MTFDLMNLGRQRAHRLTLIQHPGQQAFEVFGLLLGSGHKRFAVARGTHFQTKPGRFQ